jgi:hypothetical protein
MGIGIIVIESPEKSGTEWGISFDGPNPNQEDYFKMPDKETAFRLKDYLSEHSPVSLDESVGSPSAKF